MKTYLKVKIASLAAEAQIIKREERKWWKPVGEKEIYDEYGSFRNSKQLYKRDHPLILGLRLHRIHVVRTECRFANIAYGYLRGRAYKQIEHKCYEKPNWERVAEIVRSFSGGKYIATDMRKQLMDDLKAWASVEVQVEKAA